MTEMRSVATYFATSFSSMNTTVSLELSLASAEARQIVEREVLPFFREFEQQCSRFIDGNPLSLLNAHADDWFQVPELLYTAVRAAFEAYTSTAGSFDPRVLTALKHLGYDTSFEALAPARGASTALQQTNTPWQPQFSGAEGNRSIHLGGEPIDLGGIGKGVAVDTIAELLRARSTSGFINAGGDLQCWGTNADHELWRVAIDDPFPAVSGPPEPADPVAVVQLSASGLATSSTLKRRWHTPEGSQMHHLINPATGLPAENSLVSVTVLHESTQVAETLTKDLLLAGESKIEDQANTQQIRALWIDMHGRVGFTESMEEAVLWVKNS